MTIKMSTECQMRVYVKKEPLFENPFSIIQHEGSDGAGRTNSWKLRKIGSFSRRKFVRTMSEALHTYINNTQRPLIGLEYIAVLVGSDDTYFKAFRCLACGVSEKTVLSRHIMKHVESVDHQLQYLVSECNSDCQQFPFLCGFISWRYPSIGSTFSKSVWWAVSDSPTNETANHVCVRHLWCHRTWIWPKATSLFDIEWVC